MQNLFSWNIKGRLVELYYNWFTCCSTACEQNTELNYPNLINKTLFLDLVLVFGYTVENRFPKEPFCDQLLKEYFFLLLWRTFE